MTPADRGRLAQIVAYGLTHGEAVASIDKRLHEYMELSESEVEEAYAEAEGAINAAQALTSGQVSEADRYLLATSAISGYQSVVALVIYKVGQGNSDWRTVKVEIDPSKGAQALLEQIEQRLANVPTGRGSDPLPPADRQTTVLYVAPQG